MFQMLTTDTSQEIVFAICRTLRQAFEQSYEYKHTKQEGMNKQCLLQSHRGTLLMTQIVERVQDGEILSVTGLMLLVESLIHSHANTTDIGVRGAILEQFRVDWVCIGSSCLD